MKLVSKISNLCDHKSPTLQTDGRHAIPRLRICTKVHCAVKMVNTGVTVKWPLTICARHCMCIGVHTWRSVCAFACVKLLSVRCPNAVYVCVPHYLCQCTITHTSFSMVYSVRRKKDPYTKSSVCSKRCNVFVWNFQRILRRKCATNRTCQLWCSRKWHNFWLLTR